MLDIRFPTLPVAELQRHQACVNGLAWAPHSSCHICTAGDDSQALIWDLSSMSQQMDQGLGTTLLKPVQDSFCFTCGESSPEIVLLCCRSSMHRV